MSAILTSLVLLALVASFVMLVGYVRNDSFSGVRYRNRVPDWTD